MYAIYHSPLAFIRTLLEIGAEPNAPVDDGFPPLIAALISARDVPGSKRRTDVDEIIRLCCPSASIRTSAESTTTRRSTWPLPSGICSPSTFFSMAGPIPDCAHG